MEIKIVNAFYLDESEPFIDYILHIPYQESIFEIEDYLDKKMKIQFLFHYLKNTQNGKN